MILGLRLDLNNHTSMKLELSGILWILIWQYPQKYSYQYNVNGYTKPKGKISNPFFTFYKCELFLSDTLIDDHQSSYMIFAANVNIKCLPKPSTE